MLSTGSDTLLNPAGVAVSVWGAVYIDDEANSRIVEAQPTTVGFGHLQNRAVTGTTLTLPFSVGADTSLSSVQAYTLGTASLDFTVVTAGTTCVAGTNNVTSCNVNVQFLPTAPGLRRGEVVLFNNATPPAPIVSVPLYATGDAPLAALSPGTASLAGTGGATLSDPFQIAFDGAGNMYVANYGHVAGNVVEVPAGGGSATVVSTGGFTLAGAIGVVLDGAGNLYISDHENDRILEVTAGGVVSVLNITGLSPGLSIPTAIAMDAAGNLYISDYGNGRIVKVTPSGAGSVLGTGSFTFPSVSVLGVAVDAEETVYIPDSEGNRVVKVTASGAASLVVPAGITPVLNSPQGVAVDAFGNLYIADAGNKRIVEVTTAGVASVVQMPGQSIVTDYGVTVDTSGNVFIPDFSANHIVKVSVAGASLAFPNTNVGSASAPQTATVANLGDLPLVFAANPTYTANFSEDTGDENLCTVSISLAAGTACDVSVEFTPQSGGSLSAGIVVTNNSLNLTATTQNVAVSGTGVSVADRTAVTVSTNPSSVVLGQAITVTAVVTDTTTGHTATIPTGGVTFTDTVGSTTVSLNGGAAVTLNGAGAAILTGVTLAGAGLHTITANYVGVTGTFLASSNTTTVQVATGPIAPTIVWTAPVGGLTYGTTLSGVLNASAVSGSTPVAGTFTYTATLAGGSPIAVTGATVLGGGSYTLTATFTPANPTTYASTNASASLTVAKATPTLTLTSSAASVGVGSAVTFTATVLFTAGTPSGSVSFYDGTTLLGSGTLAMGVATYTTTNLPVGALSITAVYSGDSNFSTLTSAALTESVMTGFTLTAPTTPVTIAPGGSVMLNITVPPLGGAFTNVVTLSASGLPPGATATFNPPAVTPGSAGAPTVLTIQLAAATASIPASDLPARHGRFPVAPFSLAFVLFSTVLGRKRIPRALVLGLALAVLGVSTMFVTGCGGGSATTQSTPAGNYTVKVTGTSGTSQASTTITLAVQ